MPQKGKKRAVVLGGGGSKGSYQIGVWQAMREMGMEYQVVTGTSVGALNGAMMAQGEFDAAYDLWWNLDNSQVMEGLPPSSRDDPDSRLALYRAFVREMVTKGGLDISPLEETIRGILDEEKLRKSGVAYGIVTVDMTDLKPIKMFLREMPEGFVADYMIASASCFPVFKPRTIQNVRFDGDYSDNLPVEMAAQAGAAMKKARFIDGGYYDNLPVEMATQAGVELDEIWAVDVDGIGVRRDFTPSVPLRTVRCHWDLGNFLLFEQEQIRRNIRLGYLDAMKEAGRLDGRAYAFTAGELERFREKYGGRMEETARRLLEPMGRTAHRALKKAMGQREFLLACVEEAGEALGLEPTVQYTMEGFTDLVKERVQVERDSRGEKDITPETLPGEAAGLAEALAGLGKELALLTALENLAQQLEGGEPLLRGELLAAALPREVLAGLFLMAM